MFTGIVEEIGQIGQINQVLGTSGSSVALEVIAEKVLQDAKIGDSIAVNGVCLTITDLSLSGFRADVSAETLRLTNLGHLSVMRRVNLERPLRINDRLGGHLVQGHIDETGTITGWQNEGTASIMQVSVSPKISRYLIYKGSVTVDGVSLTIAKRETKAFEVALIPHTKEVTTLGQIKVGEKVNIEVDLIGRYVEQLFRVNQNNGEITLKFLRESGYTN